MDTQLLKQKIAFHHHIQYDVFNFISDSIAEHIWNEIQSVNSGEKTMSDFLPDGVTTIGDMIEDLKLESFIKEVATF